MLFRITRISAMLAVAASQTLAVEPAQHTVAWYRTHEHARESVLQAYQNDHSHDDTADCRNALSAAHGATANGLATTGGTDREADPAYYGHDTGMITMMLTMCANGGVPQAWCSAGGPACA